MQPLTIEEIFEYNNAKVCYICKSKFDSDDRLKLKNRDHSHYDGKYQGPACTWCNLLNRSQRQIPIYFHNFKKYDSKIIISCIKNAMGSCYGKMPSNATGSKFKILASNSQNFRSINYRSYRFADSIEHMPLSLEKLVDTLNKTYRIKDFKILMQSETIFKQSWSMKKMELICRGKGIFPYTLCDHILEMKKLRSIPKRKLFYNTLLDRPCSKADYNHAKEVWSTFKIKDLHEYNKLYNHSDVLMLAESFFLYRKVILQEFKLDPSHFFGIPSLSFNCMLKYSKIKLEHLSDGMMNDFFRKSIRGGVCFVKTRYETGEPKFKDSSFQNYIKYLDANNLYGTCMQFKLPYKNFKFLDGAELKTLEHKLLTNQPIDVDGKTGYFVEVDLDYPSSLHEAHSQWPLAPETFEVGYNDLSPFSRLQLSFCDPIKFKNKSFSEKKLVPHFYDRKNHICHIKNLLYYMSKGLILKKVHRAVSFTQKSWLKKYISFVAELRRNAKNNQLDFLGLVFKILANSTYGKFCQNPENYVHFELARNSEELKSFCSSPNFKRQTILSENLVLCEMLPEKLAYKFQYSVASTILEFSKLFMYQFFYDTLIPHFHPDVPQLLMTDTDSIIFSIYCKNFLSKFKSLPQMDFSNYPTDHFLFNKENMMKLCYFKDEFPSHYFISEFVGLRSKLYSYKAPKNEDEVIEYIKAKGYNSHAASKNLSFSKFRNCQQTFQTLKLSHKTFRGYDHKLFTIEQMKKVLSNFDSKLYIHSCNIHTSFYGSSLINPNNSSCYKCKESSVKYPLKVTLPQNSLSE